MLLVTSKTATVIPFMVLLYQILTRSVHSTILVHFMCTTLEAEFFLCKGVWLKFNAEFNDKVRKTPC